MERVVIKIAFNDALNEKVGDIAVNFLWLDQILNPKPTYFELNNLFRQLASIYGAGTNWVESVEIMIEEVENKRLKAALQVIHNDLKEGVTLADAFGMHDMFPTFCIEALRSGEESDNIADQLREIGKFLKQKQKIKKGVSNAMRPLKAMAAGVSFSIYMLTTVIVPNLAITYKDVHAELPWITAMEMMIFKTLLDYIYVPIIGILLLPYAWKWIQKNHPMFIGKMMFKLPLFKKVYYYDIQYLFAKLMSLFMKSGKNPTEALALTANVIDNHLVRSTLEYVHYQIMEGEAFAKALQNANQGKILSNVLISYIKTSETTGRSDIIGLLESAAVDFDESRTEEMEEFKENSYSYGIILCLLSVLFIYGSLYYPQFVLFTKIG